MYCEENDDSEHTFLICNKWLRQRHDVGIHGKTPKETMDFMLSSEENWRKVAEYIKTVLTQKNVDEKRLGY